MGDIADNLQAFLVSTTAHGLANTLQENKWCRRIWMVICLFCYIMTFSLSVKIVVLALTPGNDITKIKMEKLRNQGKFSETIFFWRRNQKIGCLFDILNILF